MKVPWHKLSALRVGFGKVDVLDVNSTSLTSFIASFPNQISGRKALIVGRGTNIVGRDESSDGDLVIRCSDSTMSLSSDGVLIAGAGCGLPALAEFSARSGLAGLTLLGGIPGSLGGALRMNAGANGLEIGQFVQRIQGVNCRDLTIWEWNRGDGGWGYRQSPVPADVFLVSAQFELPLSDADEEISLLQNERRRRAEITPAGHSIGSTFRNPEGLEMKSAGWYLEQCGCMGISCGALSVSLKHANWIVNLEGKPASRKEYLELTDLMRERVNRNFGIDLQFETVLI